MENILEYTSKNSCIKFEFIFVDEECLDEQFNELYTRFKSCLNEIVCSHPQQQVMLAHSYLKRTNMEKQINYLLFKMAEVPVESVLKSLVDYSIKNDCQHTLCITIQLLDMY